MKNHKQNWYHFSEEPKFGNKNGTILGKCLPIFVEKLNPSFGKNSKSHTRNFVNLAPSNPLKASKKWPKKGNFFENIKSRKFLILCFQKRSKVAEPKKADESDAKHHGISN